MPLWMAVTVPGTTIFNAPDKQCEQVCGPQRAELFRETCLGSITLALKLRCNTRWAYYTPSHIGLWQGTLEEVWGRGDCIDHPCGYNFRNFFDTDTEPCNCFNIECPAPPVPCCPRYEIEGCACGDPCLFGEEYRTVAGLWYRPINLTILFEARPGYGYRTYATVGYGCGAGATPVVGGFFWTDWSPTPFDCTAPQVVPLRQDQTLEFNCVACRGIDGPLILEPLV